MDVLLSDIIEKEKGVTLGNILGKVYQDYLSAEYLDHSIDIANFCAYIKNVLKKYDAVIQQFWMDAPLFYGTTQGYYHNIGVYLCPIIQNMSYSTSFCIKNQVFLHVPWS